MKTIVIIYLVLSAIEYFHYVKRITKVESEIAMIPASDMEYYDFSYPNRLLLVVFLPAYALVKMQEYCVKLHYGR